MELDLSIAESLEAVPADQWNALTGTDNPFLRHEFLVALERHGAVGRRYGWLPRFVLARARGRLVGALPMYLKTNSYGEFVFDWAWADAYERAGLRYYPKLVVAVPYTPVTGARILVAPDTPGDTAKRLIARALELAEELRVSSLHWLFPPEHELAPLAAQGLSRRLGVQFHWANKGYRDFDDFLDTFTAAKRKKLRRERRRVAEQGVELEVLHGNELTAEQWGTWHSFYRGTFARLGGVATLSQGFFEEIGNSLADQVVMVFARHAGRDVAAAFSLRGADALYGRHWGCKEEFHSLHFETCYYQGLDYCIRHGLQRFEPGAQGEHKVSRGFLPVQTYSAHWIAHPGFRTAVADFLHREEEGMGHYLESMREHSPYRQEPSS